MNPIIISAEYNRLEIIKLLLESSNHEVIFEYDSVFRSIKYTNKTLHLV